MSVEIKVGDNVFMDGYTTMAQSACAYDKGSVVSKAKIKYNPDNGKPYKLVYAYDQWWNAEDGSSEKGSMYYIYKPKK